MTSAAPVVATPTVPVPVPVRFFLDFVSTYSYFAAQRIDAVAARHGRVVHWQVVSLPHVFRQAGTTSPLEQPLKLAHNRQDVARLVAMSGLPFRRPDGTPDVQRARLLFHRLRRTDAGLAARFAHAAITLRFGQGVELDGARALRQACAGLGVAAGDIAAACADEPDPQDRAALVAATDEALAAGMFGAPFAAVGTQCFWGQDRVTDHLDWWLTQQAAAPEPPHPAP
jgi:2-hydroxychromene-2-carboxylate isomerase